MTEQQLLNKLLSSFSVSGDALKNTSYADDALTAGYGFVFEKNFTITGSSTRYLLIDYSQYVPTEPWQTGRVFIFPPSMNTSSSYCMVNVYRDTNYIADGGTRLYPLNANTMPEVTKTTSGTVWTVDPTGTDKGDIVLEYLVGTASTNQSGGGGTAQGLSFFIRPNTSKTLVEVVNGNGDGIILHYGQLLFEI